MKTKKTTQNRREFLINSGMAGAGAFLVGSGWLLANNRISTSMANNNINSRGYTAKDNSGKLVPWEFERKPIGDNELSNIGPVLFSIWAQ